MKRFVIVAETGSDIPKEMADKYGIYLVPMHVTFGDEMKDDGTFSPSEVCDYYEATGKLPKTSGCNPEDFVNVFDRIAKEHPTAHIIYMAYSAVTTCSYQSALVAADEIDNISFLDTKQVTIGQCATVIKLAELIDEHPEWEVEDVENAANKLIDSVKLCFTTSKLNYLRAGGRVSNATAIAGTILNIHPRIELVDGYLKATKKYRGQMEKVVVNMINECVKEKNFSKDILWLGSTVQFSDELKNEAINIAKELGFKRVEWVTCGGVITTHGGPNGFCMAGFSQ